MSTILKVDDINVYYGSIHAIKGISFEVNEGEIVTLIGANGAGKSTTLNTISGLLHSKTGHIEFMGEPLNHVPSHKVVSKGLALVPEGRRIFLQMSVQENLDMGAFSRRGGNIDADMERVFEQFPRLKERRKQVAGTLSGGEQQMLAMGRALMSNPKLPPWAWPPFWWSRSLTSSKISTRPAPRSCWWSRMHRRPCPWLTGAMCWKPERSSPPAQARNCWPLPPSRRRIWEAKRRSKVRTLRFHLTAKPSFSSLLLLFRVRFASPDSDASGTGDAREQSPHGSFPSGMKPLLFSIFAA